MPPPGPGRGIWRWMAVRGYALRAAELAGAAAGPVTSVALLIAGCALLGVAAAGGGGAVVAIVLAMVLVVAVVACCDRLALSAMLARPVSEVEHPGLYRLVRELSRDGRLPVPRLYVSPAEQPNSFSVGRGPRSAAICCTEGLLRVLDEAELRGVLGHELAHVSGHDVLGSSLSAGLATVITFPAGLARLARPGSGGSGPGLGALEHALMLLFGPVAAVIVRLAVSQERDDRLQIVLLLGRDAEFLALDLGPDALRALVPDDLGDLLGVVLGDALLQGHAHPVFLAGELRVTRVQGLERDAALDQLVLEDVKDRLGALLAVGADVDGVLAGPGDRRADAAEVEPGAYLLGRLVDRVVDFLAVELGHDVKGRFL